MRSILTFCVLTAFLSAPAAAWAKDGKGNGPKREAKFEKREAKFEKRQYKIEKREAKAFRKTTKSVVRARPVATTGRRPPMRFFGLDRNHDGRITRAEWRGNDVSFRVHDWNGDGVLSGAEVRPGAKR
jgi:hypothetical protein